MNEIEAKLAESMDSVQQWIDTTGSFVQEQAPLVAQEMIAWGQAKHMAGMCISGWIIIFCLVLLVYLFRHIKKNPGDGPMFIFWFILTAPNICWFATSTYQYLFITFAPRLYIIEQLKDIIR
jgi:hypothetical protein